MKKTSVIIATVFLALTTARAQYEFANGKLWATAQERARVEYRANNNTFDTKINDDTDWFLLNRVRVGLGAKPVDWFCIYGEIQDAREIDSTRFVAGTNPNLDEDVTDWRQGWIELANYKEFPLGLKIGRQELSYGEERLIGAFDWSNVGRVFDAVKVHWQQEKCWVDFFYAKVVLADDNQFDDKPDWADNFYGLYGRTTALDKHSWDMYGLFRDKTDDANGGPARQIFTIGTRFATNEKMAPWNYYTEIAGQFGHIQGSGGRWFGQTNTAWAAQRALAATTGIGYTWKTAWKPQVLAEYNFGSGDSNPNNDTSGTFDNLYPTNHKWYGYIDFFSWKNVHNPHIMLACQPLKKVRLQLDANSFWLVETKDSWYRANQQQIRRDLTGNADRYVGSELDLTATYAPYKWMKFQTGYSYFFTGAYVADTGKHSDAQFFYTQVNFNL